MSRQAAFGFVFGCASLLFTAHADAVAASQYPDPYVSSTVNVLQLPPGYNNAAPQNPAPVSQYSDPYASNAAHVLRLPAGYNNGAVQNPVAAAQVPQKSAHLVYYYAPGAVSPVLVEMKPDGSVSPVSSAAPVPAVQAQPVVPVVSASVPQPAASVVPVNVQSVAAYNVPPVLPVPPQQAPPQPAPAVVSPSAAPMLLPAAGQPIAGFQMPTINNAPQVQAAQSSPATPVAPLLAESEKPLYMGLETRHGIDLGVQEFYYRYREPSEDVTELGSMTGFTASGTYTFGPGLFTTLEGRYALGDLDYSGSGTSSGNFNDLWEIRGLVGEDFIMQRYSLSPYTGLGFRDLYDNNDGLSTTGAFGYRRVNQIYYLPVGVMPRMHLDESSRLTGMFEYDVLLHGSQTSYLSDGGAGDPNVENQQHSGFGIRTNVMYETPWWSIGPFLNYWDIDQSKAKWVTDNNPSTCALYSASPPCSAGFAEPANHTYEIGVQAKFHFL